MTNQNTPKMPSWQVSLIPFVALIVTIFFVIRFFGADALDGASQVSLIFASVVVVAISMIFYKVPWKKFEEAISDNIKSIASAILILLLIGAISGSWMVSGIVPTMICYGMKVITPKIFLFATCVICALVAIMTGSSWTTIATIGVALIGIGTAEGYSPGWTAGAIISGAYFGDKISPLSDTTVLASSSAGTPLFDHIRYMLFTTVPSISIALVVFLFVSIFHTNADAQNTEEMAVALHNAFNITPWVLIVPIITGVLIAKKVPALITLSLAAIMAGVCALIFQPSIIASVGDPSTTELTFKNGFMGTMLSFYSSTSVDTGFADVNELVATRGMNGMLSTIFLIICSITFGGALTGSGMMQSITKKMTSLISGRTSIVTTTVGTGVLSNMVTGDQYLSVVLTCSLYKKLYKDKGFESRLLSRSAEDSATITSVLIPWNSCGMTQATVLKVATMEYLPYCIFNIVSPFMSIFMAAIGYKIVHKDPTPDVDEQAA